MSFAKASLNLARQFPPSQRVLAVDAGQRRIKLLLARRRFGRLQVLQHQLLDLQAEGLLSAEEIQTHLQEVLDAWGHPPLAVVLPQHLATSQTIDLPIASDAQIEAMVAEEARKLGGVTESRVVYDFVRSGPAVKGRQPFWVTLCQEGEVRDRIVRLGLQGEDICDFTTTANALTAAFQQACPACHRALLVHAGAQSTVVVLFQDGGGVSAASFPVGGDFFTRALARIRNESEEAAEQRKRKEDLLTEPAGLPAFREVMDGWVAELGHQLAECAQAAPGGAQQPASFDLYVSGGAFLQPGLIAYVRQKLGLDLQQWPVASNLQPPTSGIGELPDGFEVAWGTALQALGSSPQPVSLLPEDYRLGWQRRLTRQRVEAASVVAAFLCLVLLILGTWQKARLIAGKDQWLQKVSAAQEALDAHRALSVELVKDYEDLRPLLSRQQTTGDLLASLALLQDKRTNQNLWFVLIADQQSYFNYPPANQSTNREPPAMITGSFLVPGPARGTNALNHATNRPVAKPGLIAELCVPGDGEAARRTLGELVNQLKQEPLFAKADLLPDDLRRSLAAPKVILPDRHFVLSLDFAEVEFHHPVALPPASNPAPKGPTFRAQQPPWKRSGELEPF